MGIEPSAVVTGVYFAYRYLKPLKAAAVAFPNVTKRASYWGASAFAAGVGHSIQSEYPTFSVTEADEASSKLDLILRDVSKRSTEACVLLLLDSLGVSPNFSTLNRLSIRKQEEFIAIVRDYLRRQLYLKRPGNLVKLAAGLANRARAISGTQSEIETKYKRLYQDVDAIVAHNDFIRDSARRMNGEEIQTLAAMRQAYFIACDFGNFRAGEDDLHRGYSDAESYSSGSPNLAAFRGIIQQRILEAKRPGSAFDQRMRFLGNPKTYVSRNHLSDQFMKGGDARGAEFHANTGFGTLSREHASLLMASHLHTGERLNHRDRYYIRRKLGYAAQLIDSIRPRWDHTVAGLYAVRGAYFLMADHVQLARLELDASRKLCEAVGDAFRMRKVEALIHHSNSEDWQLTNSVRANVRDLLIYE